MSLKSRIRRALIDLEINRLNFRTFEAVCLTSEVHFLVDFVYHLKLNISFGVSFLIESLRFGKHLLSFQSMETFWQRIRMYYVLIVFLRLRLFKLFKIVKLYSFEELSEVNHKRLAFKH